MANVPVLQMGTVFEYGGHLWRIIATGGNLEAGQLILNFERVDDDAEDGPAGAIRDFTRRHGFIDPPRLP